MGRITVNGLDALMDDLSDLAKLPDSVIDSILNAEADVIVEAQKRSAQKMGVHKTGVTMSSIKKGKVKKTGNDRSIIVSPQGKNPSGARNAEVAFVNEYGKKGQPARPFIRTANEQAQAKAVEAGEKIYHAYLDKKNL